MKNILIAGSSGNIGSFLLKNLVSNHNIDCIGRQNYKGQSDFTVLDLTNFKSVKQFSLKSKKYDILIFLVCLNHGKGTRSDLKRFTEINYNTLVILLNALQNENKLPYKIVFASTISVYGEKYSQTFYDEAINPQPYSPYAATKLMAENYLIDNFIEKSWLLRIAPVYSPDFLLNIYRRTKVGSTFFQVGKGLNQLSLCNIENVGIVIEAIINEKVPAGIYNISDAKQYIYKELLELQDAVFVIRIPKTIVGISYHLGKLFGNIFLRENAIKLINDNIYPSEKIRTLIELPYSLKDLKNP